MYKQRIEFRIVSEVKVNNEMPKIFDSYNISYLHLLYIASIVTLVYIYTISTTIDMCIHMNMLISKWKLLQAVVGPRF